MSCENIYDIQKLSLITFVMIFKSKFTVGCYAVHWLTEAVLVTMPLYRYHSYMTIRVLS